MHNFGIVVSRWYGIWSWVWSADIMHEPESNIPYVSFNALSKRGALRKAKRYINRLSKDTNPIYVYDSDNDTLEKVNV